MQGRQYAVVSYLSGPLAEFAEGLRGELTPGQAHLRAHITVLHPRLLVTEARRQPGNFAREPELAACAIVDRAGAQLAHIRVSLGEVASFAPAHPTIYLPVEDGARHLRYLNSLLKADPFDSLEQWDYVPHLTLATLADNEAAACAHKIAAEAWQAYRGPRDFLLEELSLVREESPDCWFDVHNASLGA